MFRIALCDDKKEFLKQEYTMAKDYLTSKGELCDIKMFTSGSALISENAINSYDLILLDYDMYGMNGFETATRIREQSETVSIAFVTGFYQFSRAAYRFDAIRYLVKNEPTFEEEFQDCIDKAIRIYKFRPDNRRQFDFVEQTMVVDLEKIVYILVRKHYLEFNIWEGNEIIMYRMRETMQNIYEKVRGTQFFSLAKSGLLLNLKYVESIDRKGNVTISTNVGKQKYQLSDLKKTQFMSDYMRYRGGGI